MRMLSIIALSFAFVNVASAATVVFETKIDGSTFSVTKGTVDGKDMTDAQKKEVEGYLKAAGEAHKKAVEGGTATLGFIDGLIGKAMSIF